MSIKTKHLLKDSKEKDKRFGERCVDLFFFKDEINKVECCLCIPLAEKLGAEVYWYKTGNHAVVCVMEENIYEAIKYGKELVIKNFDNMTTEYLEKGKLHPVLDDYSIIATYVTDDIYGLWSWCHNIDYELIVKTNLSLQQCVLTKEPLEFTSRIKAAQEQNPFRTLLNFDFYKI